jgi:hypothetical protein
MGILYFLIGWHLLYCLAAVAATCAPIAAAWFIWYVVRRINRRDVERVKDPLGHVPEEVLQKLTPHQLSVLKSHFERHPE